MDRKAIKAKAKEFAFSHKWDFWKGLLLIAAGSFAVSFVVAIIKTLLRIPEESATAYIIQFLLMVAITPMAVGILGYYIKLIKGQKTKASDELLSKYKKEYLWKTILVCFATEFIILGMSLLLIIPGIIYAFKYAMTYYILAEQTPKELNEGEKAFNISSKLMNGYKWDYFVFNLSFIGWVLLCFVTLGIASIWAMPYMTAAQTMYYEELKKINK